MEEKYHDWFEGFKTIVSEQLGEETYEKVVKDCTKCKSITNDPEMAECMKELMENFDSVVDKKEKKSRVMETMGYYCFQNHFLERALQVKDKSKGIKEIIKNLNQIIGDEEYFKLKGNVSKGKSYIYTNALVTSGLYSIVRHVQYTGGIVSIFIATPLLYPHWIFVLLGIPGILLSEERHPCCHLRPFPSQGKALRGRSTCPGAQAFPGSQRNTGAARLRFTSHGNCPKQQARCS